MNEENSFPQRDTETIRERRESIQQTFLAWSKMDHDTTEFRVVRALSNMYPNPMSMEN